MFYGTGGIITEVGSERVHKFTSNGTFIVTGSGNIKILVVAGGGGGGTNFAGGGGGGGVIYEASYPVSEGEYAITIGDGGLADNNGEDSSFADLLIAIGGGKGGLYLGNGYDGGSGGGGGSAYETTTYGGNPEEGQGYAGGQGSSVGPLYPAGGGGGGGGVGENAHDNLGGDGGIGFETTILDDSTDYFAGGGGGGNSGSGDGGDGGLGGGGDGGTGNSGSHHDGYDAEANTGGGGGGGGTGTGVGGIGGSGIIIIRYIPDYEDILDQSTIGSGGAEYFGHSTRGKFIYQSFVPTISSLFKRFRFQFKIGAGSPDGILTGYLYNDNGGVPGTLLTTLSSFNATELSSSWADYDFLYSNITYTEDLCNGGTAIASSYHSLPLPPANAFDDNSATIWHSASPGGGLPQWIGYDFGSGVTKVIQRITLKMDYAGGNNYCKDFKFQGSNNGSDYTDIYTGQTTNDGNVQTFSFSNSTAYRYYRIYITTSWSGDYGSLAEVEMMEKISLVYNPDFLTGGTATAEYTETAASLAVNNNISDYWYPGALSYSTWWKYDLGEGITKIARKLTMLSSYSSTYIPKTFILAGSNDNSNWTNITTINTAQSTSKQTFYFNNSVAYRYYRVMISADWGAGTLVVNEFELMEVSNPYPIVASTKYHMVVGYSKIDDSNYIHVNVNTNGALYPDNNNGYGEIDSWSPQSYDIGFEEFYVVEEIQYQKEIDSDAKIKVLGAQKEIDSDTKIVGCYQKTINSEARIIKQIQQEIDSDTKIKVIDNQKFIDSDTKIVFQYQEEINSDAAIANQIQKTIDSNSKIKVLGAQKEIDSDAKIVIRVNLITETNLITRKIQDKIVKTILNVINGTRNIFNTNLTVKLEAKNITYTDLRTRDIDYDSIQPKGLNNIIINKAELTNFLIGGTASADNEFPGYSASRACDGLLTEEDGWYTEDIPFPHWWKYDLGTGVTQKAHKLKILSASGGQLKNFKLQGSNNNSTWTDLYIGIHSTPSAWEEYNFVNNIAYRYYRLYIIDNWRADGYSGMVEIELS